MGELTGGRILVVDDDADFCAAVAEYLVQVGFNVEQALDAGTALEMVQGNEPDAVLADINLGLGTSGLTLCGRLVSDHPGLPVVVVTGYGSMESAVSAIRAGACDFVTKPISTDGLEHTLRRAVEKKRLRDEVKRLKERTGEDPTLGDLLGTSPAMRRVSELIAQVSCTDASVLISGESGTGKELAARAIHARGSRGEGPFIALNCAAMPASLLESELFGHVRGAFTDAKRSRSGLFVQASGGTLFLDEIGEMPLEMQAKLLRVLQDRRVRPVGGDTEVLFDTRIICATNRDLEADVAQGRFREDLYYRIHVVRIEMPPLRRRGEDTLMLAQHFLRRSASRHGKEVHGLSPVAARKLLEYDWPGNVRELENSMERALALTRTRDIEPEDLPDRIRDYQSTQVVISGDDPDALPTIGELEQRYIRRVLKAVGGNKARAARVLGLDRRTLYRKLERYARAAGRQSGGSSTAA